MDVASSQPDDGQQSTSESSLVGEDQLACYDYDDEERSEAYSVIIEDPSASIEQRGQVQCSKLGLLVGHDEEVILMQNAITTYLRRRTEWKNVGADKWSIILFA